jgi:hypothetical protein
MEARHRPGQKSDLLSTSRLPGVTGYMWLRQTKAALTCGPWAPGTKESHQGERGFVESGGNTSRSVAKKLLSEER